jgi:trigger factor
LKSQIKPISETEQELELTLEPAEFQSELDNEYRNAQKKANLKGFRKGKAPLSIIKRLLGEQIQVQVVEKLAGSHFEQVSKDENIKIIGQARIRDFNLVENESLTIYLNYEIQPEFDLKTFEDYEFKKVNYQITDEDVDKELKALLRNYAKTEVVDEPATKSDVVVANLQKVDENGVAIVGENLEKQTFNLDYLKSDSPFLSALEGSKTGDERQVVIEDENPETKEQVKTHYQVTVLEVKRVSLPEFNDEYAEKLSQGKIKTTDEFKADLKEQIVAHYTKKSDEDLFESIADKFTEENVFPLPLSLVDSYENMLVENAKRQVGGNFPPGFDEIKFRHEIRPNAEKHARWMLIRSKLAEMNDIKVDEEDLKVHAEKEAAMVGVDTDTYMKQIMSSEYLPYITDSLMRDKVMEHIKNTSKITEESQDLPN